MDEFLMKPKVDFAFKEIMYDETALKGFIAATMDLNPKDIKSVTILNTDLRKVHADDKQGILDVNVLMNDNTEIDIEIQLSEMLIWPDRSTFYLAKKFVDQIKEGEPYSVLKKCVSISILDFKLFKNESSFYSRFHIAEDTRHFIYTNKVEFHVIELPKLPREIQESSSDLLLWAKFFASEKKEDFEMLAGMNAGINSAYQRLQVISQDDKKRQEYEARMKALRDYNQGMLEAEERGMEKGLREGRLEGRKAGQKILIESMLGSMPVEEIARITQMSVSSIRQILES